MAAQANARTARRLAATAAVMLGLSFAAVPFYDWFCRVTGYGGATSRAEAPTAEPLDQTVIVRFDSNVAPGLGWNFRPVQRTVEARLGESVLVFYEAENLTDAPLAGTASYNVTPFAAGGYFSKIACFCFELQVLQPGERVEMPVSFFVDPALVEDVEGRGVHEITLSYTMHPADLPETAAADTETEVALAAPAAEGN
jgi:cytochrome c oxidase assembly protein subunit 11